MKKQLLTEVSESEKARLYKLNRNVLSPVELMCELYKALDIDDKIRFMEYYNLEPNIKSNR